MDRCDSLNPNTERERERTEWNPSQREHSGRCGCDESIVVNNSLPEARGSE